jgi:hypothetical protein
MQVLGQLGSGDKVLYEMQKIFAKLLQCCPQSILFHKKPDQFASHRWRKGWVMQIA